MSLPANCFGISLTPEMHTMLQDNLAAIFSSSNGDVSVPISSILDLVKHTLPKSITCKEFDVPRLIQLARCTTPDFTIGDIFFRWHLIHCADDQYGIYLHHILDEDKRWPHDHPWNFISLVIEGKYDEFVFLKSAGKTPTFAKSVRTIHDGGVFRSASTAHFTEVSAEGGAWSIVLREPMSRSWGFRTEKEWVQWSEYVDSDLYTIHAGGTRRTEHNTSGVDDGE